MVIFSRKLIFFSGLLEDTVCHVAVLVDSELCIYFDHAVAASGDLYIIQ